MVVTPVFKTFNRRVSTLLSVLSFWCMASDDTLFVDTDVVHLCLNAKVFVVPGLKVLSFVSEAFFAQGCCGAVD